MVRRGLQPAPPAPIAARFPAPPHPRIPQVRAPAPAAHSRPRPAPEGAWSAGRGEEGDTGCPLAGGEGRGVVSQRWAGPGPRWAPWAAGAGGPCGARCARPRAGRAGTGPVLSRCSPGALQELSRRSSGAFAALSRRFPSSLGAWWGAGWRCRDRRSGRAAAGLAPRSRLRPTGRGGGAARAVSPPVPAAARSSGGTALVLPRESGARPCAGEVVRGTVSEQRQPGECGT